MLFIQYYKEADNNSIFLTVSRKREGTIGERVGGNKKGSGATVQTSRLRSRGHKKIVVPLSRPLACAQGGIKKGSLDM